MVSALMTANHMDRDNRGYSVLYAHPDAGQVKMSLVERCEYS